MEVILGADGRYQVGDRRPARVTEVLNLFFPPSDFYTEAGRMKGTARHEWFHALIQGIEIENDPDERIAAEVASFRKFLDEVKPRYISGEVAYFDEALNVAGRPDLVAEIAGRLAVVDYKPAAKNKRTALQTAAYKRMLNLNGVAVLDRYELRLLDGSYRLDKHRNPDDEKRWPILAAAFHAVSHYK